MKSAEVKYAALNELAEQGGIVILGGEEDMNLPLCELKQAFSLNSSLYNRSVRGLSVNNAKEVYDLYIRPLQPECILLHLGAADTELFLTDSEEFDRRMHEVVRYIKAQNQKCEIALISLRNHENDANIASMNKHLQYIAESERCRYGDIAARRVWNPKETQSAVSFVYSIGFVHPLKNKHPLSDIIRILFCYSDSKAS